MLEPQPWSESFDTAYLGVVDEASDELASLSADANVYTFYTMYQMGPHRTDPTRIRMIAHSSILIFSTNTNCEHMAYRSLRSETCSARGVRKVTTGVTGLWQPNVHSDVAF